MALTIRQALRMILAWAAFFVLAGVLFASRTIFRRYVNFDSAVNTLMVGGFGAGLFWFFKGFRDYREYRVLADVPETPIRSIPMGLVEIHGKAKPVGDQLVDSPVSRTPCLFYKVDIAIYVRNPKGGGWKHHATDCNGVPFYLDDGTGKVLVKGRGAEFDLILTVVRDTENMGQAGSGASAAELIDYALSVHPLRPALDQTLVQSMVPPGVNGLDFTPRLCFWEYCILPDHWYDVTGTCIENPTPKDEHDRNMIVKGQNEPTFLISWRSEKEIERTLRNRAALHIFGGAILSIVCLGLLLFRLGWL